MDVPERPTLTRHGSTPVLTITPSANLVNAIKRANRAPTTQDLTEYIRPETGEKVSTQERVVKDVAAPATRPPTDEEFWLVPGQTPNVEFLKNHFALEGRLTHEQAEFILTRGTELLTKEPNLLELEGPITICGDVHGQYFDLIKLFEVGGTPGEIKYLFLGDYVDRGYFSIECVLYLWSLKIAHPDHVFLLRGNHECRHLTEYFTFKLECIHKYSEELYDMVLESFCALPLSATVNKQFLCVHGGISPEWMQLEDVQSIHRFREPPTHGLMCDILWSDPLEDYDKSKSDDFFIHNDQRGCSYYYSYPAVCAFLERNNLLSLIRAHEVQDAGYRLYKARKSTNFASMITLFSAPNYLDAYKNKAAVLRYDTNTMNIRQFSWSPHPYWLPNFMDVFTWSMPFVGEKISDMLLALLSICSREELEEEKIKSGRARIVIKMPEGVDEEIKKMETLAISEQEAPAQDVDMEEPIVVEEITSPTEQGDDGKRRALYNKIMAVSKVGGILRTLREENEAVSELKNIRGTARLPAGSLANGADGIRAALVTFDEARMADHDNEHIPPSPTDADYEPTMVYSTLPKGASGGTLGRSGSGRGTLGRAPSLKRVKNLKKESLVDPMEIDPDTQ